MYKSPLTIYYNHLGYVGESQNIHLFVMSEFLKITDHGIIK